MYSKKPALAYSLKTWSNDVILLTDGPARLTPADRDRLDRHQIPLRKDKIARLEGASGKMRRIVFENGETLDRDAIFFSTAQHQACDLVSNLGCILNNRGTVETDKQEMSKVPGLYVAGDASHDVQMVIVAAAEGAKAAIAINASLQAEDGVAR